MNHLIEKELKVLSRVDKALVSIESLTKDEELLLTSARILLTKLSLSFTRRLLTTKSFISPDLEHKERHE